MENRIAELRKEKGMTLKQLGETLGVRDNTLSQYETGKRNPQLGLLQEIADLFQVSIEYLTKNTDKRDFPVNNDEDMLKILDMIDNHTISLLNLSKLTMLELALRILKKREEFSEGKYQKYKDTAFTTLHIIEKEVEVLDRYKKVRKEHNDTVELIYEKLIHDETNITPNEVLTFIEEADRIDFEELKKILDYMKKLPNAKD